MKVLKITVWALAAIFLLLVLSVFLLETREPAPQGNQDVLPTQTQQATSGTLSWEAYQEMSLEEQDAFIQQFESVELFEKWKESVKPTETTIPVPSWNKPGKLPSEYTWEEYVTLSLEEQDAFSQWFASQSDFEQWMEAAKPQETTAPTLKWNKPGKTPDAYTLAEYEALTAEEKEAFYLWFRSEAAFAKWQEKVKPVETTAPAPSWIKPGKLPDAYTWEEYEALSPEDQDAFYLWFGSQSAFEQWMEAAKPAETTDPTPVWNKPGKLPNEYTWEEYVALSREDQDAFSLWFGSEAAFEQWKEATKPAETTDPTPVWDKPGKLPNEYTWAEYMALSMEDQDAFFLWFDSIEAFESWMQSVKPTETTTPKDDWANAEKQPNQYTWAEYEALTPEEKDAFFQWFESVEAFESWMESVQ